VGDAAAVDHWEESAATLDGARMAAWAEPAARYWPRAFECADVVLDMLGDVERTTGGITQACDLGCGPGRMLSAVWTRRPTWGLLGVDWAPSMCHWAWEEAKGPGRRLGTFVFCDDITDLSEHWAAEFDAAWSVAVLQHMTADDQRRTVASVGRILRRGGRAVVQVVEGDGHAPLAHDTTAAELDSMADAAGLVVVDRRRGLVQPGWLWATLERPCG
jgi:SAM-dependent methyltransferase